MDDESGFSDRLGRVGCQVSGSHRCVELLAAGYDLVVVHNLSNSSVESLRQVAGIAGVGLSVGDSRLRGNDGAGDWR